MKPSEMDRLFDESFNRATNGRGALSGAYETSPLAADHLLLKRSWEYFRQRMNALDDHWKKILESKEMEIRGLSKEMNLIKQKDQDLYSENETFRSLDEEYTRSKATDYLTFQKETQKLKTAWEEEREVFLRREGEYEMRIAALEGDLGKLKDEFLVRQNQWVRETEAVQSQMNTILEQQRRQHEQWASDMAKKEEETLNLNSKIDLLRPEVERRDQRIHELKDDARKQENEKDVLVQHITDLTKKIREEAEQNSLLNERLAILQKEKEVMREAWSHEQAEWRELWERERELWDRKKGDKNELVDNK